MDEKNKYIHKIINSKITTDINIFSKLLTNNGKTIGLDVGKKNIGVSVSDNLRKVALNNGTLKRKNFKLDTEKIKIIIKENNIDSFVIGFPLNLKGEIGPSAQSVLTFSYNIEKIFKIPILLWDERYSSLAVEKVMIKDDLSRIKRSKIIDMASATWILQGALDSIAFNKYKRINHEKIENYD